MPVEKHLFSGKPFTRAARVSIDFIYFWGSNKKQRSCDGGGGRGARRPVWGGSEFKKTGARSARARTRGQNPLVLYMKLVIILLQYLGLMKDRKDTDVWSN